MGRAAIEATKSILRRILYVAIFCFTLYGITSIGILVDRSRKKNPVSLSTALILLAILLAFLVIFTIIICLWRQANQNIKSRQRGRDEEERWREDENGNRYIRTDSELKAIKKREKYETRQKDRRRSILDRIHHAGNRISGRQIFYPWDARDERDNPIRGPGPLNAHPPRKSSFVQKQEPLFGHGDGTGVFGGRPAMAAGLNPNHSRTRPASPRSPSKVRRTEGKTKYPERVYNRPENSEYTAEEFEEWARRQQNAESQAEQVRKENNVLDAGYLHRQGRGVASYNVERAEKSGVEERPGRQEKNGAGREVSEEKVAVLNASRTQPALNTLAPRHTIPRKEVGTPPRRDPGILGAKLHDGQAAILMRESGITIGYGGERVIMGPGRLPSKLVGHGLMAMPSQAHLRMVGQGHAGHESWRQGSGFYANRMDGILSMVSEEKSDGSRESERSGKSWAEMTADEAEKERKRRRKEKLNQKNKRKGNGKYKPYVPGDETTSARPLVVRNRTPTPPSPIRKDSPKTPTVRTELRKDINNDHPTATDLNRSPSAIHRKTQQEKERMEEEQWLHRASCFHSDNQRARQQQEEGRKRSGTYPYHHLSALPDGLHISPKQPALKKAELSRTDLKINTPQYGRSKRNVEVVQETHSFADQSQPLGINATTYKAYVVHAAAKHASKTANANVGYQQPGSVDVDEQRKDKTEWQRQKRVREWTERNEAEKARQELLEALQPQHQPSRSQHPSQPATPAPDSFADWRNRYNRNARARGVSGFTSASVSTTVSVFPSYEEMEQERIEKAVEEERRKFSELMSRTENQRSSEIERVVDSTFPIDATELARIDAMVDAQLEHDKRATEIALDGFRKQTAGIAKPRPALDSMPSRRNLAEARLAQENQEWARKNHEAAAKLEVRSLHTTERGTTFSSVQGKPSVAAGSTPAKSGIPRWAEGSAQISTPGTGATSGGRHKPSPGAFGYQSGKEGTVRTQETRKRPAKVQGLGSASKKPNTTGAKAGARPGPSGLSSKKEWI